MNLPFGLGLASAGAVNLVICWLGWQLLRQNGRMLLRLDALEKRLEPAETDDEEPKGLPLGGDAPTFELPDLLGEPKSLTPFRGQLVLLIFFNPDCGFCREMLPQLAAIESERGQSPSAAATDAGVSVAPSNGVMFPGPLRSGTDRGPQLLILTTGEAEKNRQLFAEHKVSCPVVLQKDGELARAYQARGTPSGYVISPEGKITSNLAMGAEALLKLAAGKAESGDQQPENVQGLVTSAATEEDGRASRFGDPSLANSRIKRDGLQAGTPAPDFRLPRLDGKGELSLGELRGRPVFLVFSSPHCGPCNTLAPKLEKLHRKHPDLEVVIISRGELEENREKVKEHGLTFPVVLQKQWEISRLYALFASPVAYLIDREGVITAEVAVGVDSILELMTRLGPLRLQEANAARLPLLKRLVHRPVAWTSTMLDWLLRRVTVAKGGIDTFELKHFKFVPRADDIFIVTYPRSGTTWMQMILYQLTTDGSMDFKHIAEHSPWFERSEEADSGYEVRAGPRVFKSHLSYEGIPKGPGRYLYVARDGRDVALSYYHLYRSHNGYQGTFPEFFELFMAGQVMHGSWFEHVGGWWKHRHELNVLFLTYEELQADLEGCLRRIIAFCHLTVPPEKLPLLVERCSFAFMKQHEDKFDPAVEALQQQGLGLNRFVRAGRVGDGARHLDQKQQTRFDEAFQMRLGAVSSLWQVPSPLGQPVLSASYGSG